MPLGLPSVMGFLRDIGPNERHWPTKSKPSNVSSATDRLRKLQEVQRVEAAQAISLVTKWIQSRNLDYPTDGLEADRFDAGWSVYAPVEVDESDPMAFLDMPVGRSIFLVGDSGRIQEVSSSIPPQQAQAEFAAQELAAHDTDVEAESDFISELERQFDHAEFGESTGLSAFADTGTAPEEGALDLGGDAAVDGSELIGQMAQQLSQLGTAGWTEFRAEF